MATYHLRRLSRPDQLRAIDSRYLEQLLTPFSAFLAVHGVTLPLRCREASLKYTALAQLLLSPPTDTPGELLDAFYFINELATPLGIEALEAAANAVGIGLHQYLDVTPAEIVLQVWLAHRPLVERVHAEMAIGRLRTFEYFQPEAAKTPQLADVPNATLRAMESELNECFRARRRGRYARILLSETEDTVWLYVGHGGLLRREGTVEECGPSSICYRPEIYDAMVFVRSTGELGIHARSQWETALYQRLCGEYLFGDEKFFAGTAKYTLAPLVEYGRDALQCLDVPGMEWVRLTDIAVQEPGRSPRFDRSKGDDLFTSWGSNRLPYSPRVRLINAGFRIKILGCRKPQRVVIRPSNRAQYPQNIDPTWIETWFTRRGFSRRKGGLEHAIPEKVLAVA